MYRLFHALWRRQRAAELVDSFTVHKPMTLSNAPLDLESRCPPTT